MRLGAHVSAAGGLPKAIQRAHDIGAECAQIFVGAPQQWRALQVPDADVAEFRALATTLDVEPNVVHAPYLVNLAAADAALRAKSIAALTEQMGWCDRLAMLGLVVHVGSARDTTSRAEALRLVADGIAQVVAASTTASFLIENTAGMGASIGSRFEDLADLIALLGGDPRVGICLDTAHTFEAGFDISTAAGSASVLATFTSMLGSNRLRALHVNDSKTAFGSHVDRHENLGEGKLGSAGLTGFLTNPLVRDLPCYLEVPGTQGRGPDRTSIDTLRDLAKAPPLPLSDA